ncbi:hypothetical protein H0B56_01655 [Haloechinothrix sp. YIM 98757]|uniref:Uncharacterized protein n=1 Tax=Haloechinothrix aidingensis TaxID=2752311 RepID=A0A838A7T4_9PSEU|nr:hypothetical protein [Haloechinothrix aidingensis]MBA0124242.1 hypothetical protein [Haloechinothrix aidingensis]
MTTGMGAGAELVVVPEMVRAGLERVRRQYVRSLRMPQGSDEQNAAHWARVAEVYRREARWWAVLERWVFSLQGRAVGVVFADAAIQARNRAERFAQDYEKLAARARNLHEGAVGVSG